MDTDAWKKRAYAAGLTNVRLGQLLHMLRPAVSRLYSDRSKRGLPRYVKALIVAWENLPEEGRRKLLAEMSQDAVMSEASDESRASI